MLCRLKRPTVGFCAALAITAILAPAAYATGHYEADDYPTTATAEIDLISNDTITMEAGTVECKYQHLEGTLQSGPTSTFTVKAKYNECKAFTFTSATVSMGSCDYLFNTPTGSGLNWSATVSIKCTNPANPIQITAGTCKATIGEQTAGGSVTLTVSTIFGMVTATANLTGIKYTVVQDGLGCMFNGTGSKTGATYVQDSGMDFVPTSGGTFGIS